MKIGFIGLGKLGLPCATCVAMKGHKVKGYDLDPSRMSHEPQPYQEAGPLGTGDFNDILGSQEVKRNLTFGTVEEVAHWADIIFIAVQTPHDAQYEGVTRIPMERRDFDYTYLIKAVSELSKHLLERGSTAIVTIISTCLPGTMERCVLPLLPQNARLVYNPFFIAMGTTMRDFLDPEFVLLGGNDKEAMNELEEFYKTLHDAPCVMMSLPSAELTKVTYNTFISFKIAFANTVMEICDQIPDADCDDVVEALMKGHRRIISPGYLHGGMGDGGGCHPRDNIAMSWLARKLGLSFDLFDAEMRCRERQADWLRIILSYHRNTTGLPVVILGYSFKPETNLTVGSPAILVQNLLKEEGVRPIMVDEHVNPDDKEWISIPAIYLIGCRHPEYAERQFPDGSIVIDPHRYVCKQLADVKVHRLGQGEPDAIK